MMNGLRRNDAEELFTAGTTKMPMVSVVILNWNGKEYLQKFLPSILAATYSNMRVIVADNGSTDDSVIFLQQNFPAVEILISTINEGFARGYNTALQQVESDYYVLLNNDVEVAPGWIEPVVDLMENDKQIGACQPKMLSYNDRNFFEYAGACGGWLDALGYPFARGRIFDVLESDTGQYDDAQPCFWATGAAMFVRADVYHGAGGFDEFFFAHQEEIDLCWRLKLAGYKVFVQPASVVYHVGGGTLSKGNKLKTFLNFRNNLVMLAKNLPMGKAITTIGLRLPMDGLAAWRALFTGDAGFFVSVCKSHVHFVKWLVFHRKPKVKKLQQKPLLSGWYNGSLVWQHFINKKKLFSEIVKNK